MLVEATKPWNSWSRLIYTAFITPLQSLRQHCAYKDEFTAEVLRNGFVFGINNVQIQHQLFWEKDEFSLQTAIDTVWTNEQSYAFVKPKQLLQLSACIVNALL